jgi:hypothetical protein
MIFAPHLLFHKAQRAWRAEHPDLNIPRDKECAPEEYSPDVVANQLSKDIGGDIKFFVDRGYLERVHSFVWFITCEINGQEYGFWVKAGLGENYYKALDYATKLAIAKTVIEKEGLDVTT